MTTAAATATPTVYGRIVATTPLYGATCDLCPRWLGLVTTDLDAHMWDVRLHAAKHPDPTAGARWTPGSVAPRPVTRGEEVGRVPVYRVMCDECPDYEGAGSTDRARLAEYIELHETVHAAHRLLRAELSYDAIAAHRAAVKADPGRWNAHRAEW